jgi:hypothetical protein
MPNPSTIEEKTANWAWLYRALSQSSRTKHRKVALRSRFKGSRGTSFSTDCIPSLQPAGGIPESALRRRACSESGTRNLSACRCDQNTERSRELFLTP